MGFVLDKLFRENCVYFFSLLITKSHFNFFIIKNYKTYEIKIKQISVFVTKK